MLPLIDNAETLDAAYRRLRDAWTCFGEVDVRERLRTLAQLRLILVDNAPHFAAALGADFKGRSAHESLLTEVALVLSAIDYTCARLKVWAAPYRIFLGWPHWLASAKMVKSGRGVVAIIGPGNYPLQLVLMPLISSLAAGCRTLLKPSESAPRTAALLQKLLADSVDSAIVSIVLGGPGIAAKLTELPFDVLLFTGSRQVGGKVALAAAAHLTPTILELGGKSAVIIDRSADLRRAAQSIVWGKLLNAGQTCVAPDYVLVPAESLTRLSDEMVLAAAHYYPDPAARDYTAILNEAEFSRLLSLEAGQTAIRLFANSVLRPLYEPKLLINPQLSSPVMREEIFGPLLPLVPYETLTDAVAVVNALPTALVLYWFGVVGRDFRNVIERTRSAAVSINETVIHAGLSELPLGGLGASGMGRYHGRAGFDAFTHERPFFRQARWSFVNLMRPPYTARADAILKRLLR